MTFWRFVQFGTNEIRLRIIGIRELKSAQACHYKNFPSEKHALRTLIVLNKEVSEIDTVLICFISKTVYHSVAIVE